MQEVVGSLVKQLHHTGPGLAIDIDAALQCEAFDVIGAVGFGKAFGATGDLGGAGAAACRVIKDSTWQPLQELRRVCNQAD